MSTGYTYDTVGRLKTVTDGTATMATYNYNPDSTLSGIAYHTGITVTYGYDRDKNITSLVNKGPNGGEIGNYAYTYDGNGNQLSKTENGIVTNYTYDKVDRLLKENAIEFAYDKAGNRISRTNGAEVTTYGYDARNRLTNSETNGVTTTYSYDNNGNMLSMLKEGKTTTYTYDSFNRLKEVTNPDGSWMRNIYGPGELRTAAIENGIRRDFITDRGSVIAELNGQNGLVSRQYRGIGLVAQKDASGALSYYLHNAHGDVVNLVNGSGEVLNSYTYDAFGNTLSYAEKVSNRFMYAGEQFDKLTGQYYLRARHYQPGIGRFVQEDSYRGEITDPLSLHLYIYCLNDPIKYVDPSGHRNEDSKCEVTDGTDISGITLTRGDLIFLYNNEFINYLPMKQKAAVFLKLKEKGTITGDDLVNIGIMQRKEYRGFLGFLEKTFDISNPDNLASLLETSYTLNQYGTSFTQLEFEEQQKRQAEVQGLIYYMAANIASSMQNRGGNVPEPEFKGFNFKGTSKTTAVDWVGRTSDLAKSSPIAIPSNAVVKVQQKAKGYDMISYKWSDGTYTYNARWHTPTSNAPAGSGNSWVVERVTPGTPTGQLRVEHVYTPGVNGNWTPMWEWKAAVDAYNKGTTTALQDTILNVGHINAP